jgi:hypothetical protein
VLTGALNKKVSQVNTLPFEQIPLKFAFIAKKLA